MRKAWILLLAAGPIGLVIGGTLASIGLHAGLSLVAVWALIALLCIVVAAALERRS